MRFEDFLRSALSCKSVRSTGRGGGGCISRGQTFILDEKEYIFVKENDQAKVKIIFCFSYWLAVPRGWEKTAFRGFFWRNEDSQMGLSRTTFSLMHISQMTFSWQRISQATFFPNDVLLNNISSNAVSRTIFSRMHVSQATFSRIS